MGCGGDPEKDEEGVNDSMNGESCEPASEISEEINNLENPSLQEEAGRVEEIENKVEEAKEEGKALTDSDIKNEIEKLTPTAAQSFVDKIRDDQPITYLPPPSELSKEEMEKLREICSEYKGRVFIMGHTNMYESNIKVKEGISPVIHYHHHLPTGENLQRMVIKNYSPIGSDGKPLHLHHWHQERGGPLIAMEASTHQKLSGLLHKYEPSERVTQLDRKAQREKYWEEWAKEYLGPYYEMFIEIFQEEEE